jgi:hypothetical protein
MRSFIKTAILFPLLYLATSCSNDFLNENLTSGSVSTGLSNIYVSPNWQSSDYFFKLQSVKEADYEIVSKPSWLKTASDNGHVSDSIAIIQCSATKSSDFDKIGIFMDFMTVKAGEKQYKVPVGYITEGNPKAEIPSSFMLSYSYYSKPTLSIKNNGAGILLWDIKSMPYWLAIDTVRLKPTDFYIPSNGSLNLPFCLNLNKPVSGNLTGTMVLTTNDKDHPSVAVNVTADLGTPRLSIYTNSINFAYTETSKTLSFYGGGNGLLFWKFEDLPNWLTITPSSGMSSTSSSSNVVFSCDRTKLAPGQNSAIVTLKTNDSSNPSYSIKVLANAPGNSANISAVNGNITDALFNKNTNTLYYVTSLPNKLVAYDVTGRKVVSEIALSKAPTCLAISEDWTKAAVGHNGYISAINLSTNTVTATYTLNYSVNDIAWAENNWFCYTQNGGSFSGLHWINAANGTLYDDPDTYSLDANSIVKKVPNQPYLIATRNSSSPSGFFAYDIATKSKKSYAHMDLTNFWFSKDGDYIFAKNLNVYRTTSSTGSTDKFNNTINMIGKINLGIQNYYGLQYLYHGNNSLWVIQNPSYSTDVSTSVYQIEDNDYTLVKQYDCDPTFQPDTKTATLTLCAKYVFANNAETEIAVLCKDINSNFWVIQFMAIK